MLAAFGFVRSSCSLFTHCFTKTKRRRRHGSSRRQGSDSDDEDSMDLSRKAVSATKSAIAQVAIRVRPKRSFSRPRLSSLWACFIKRNQPKRETAVAAPNAREQQGGEASRRDSGMRNRRHCNKTNRLFEVFGTIPWPQLDIDRESAASLSSVESSHYPSESLSDCDTVSCGFGMGSSISPITTMESILNEDGLNPAFFGIHSSDEDEAELLQKPPAMRRISSFVNGDLQLQESIRDGRNQQLLINPAYRRDSVESSDDSDVGDTDCEAETKMKSFNSLVETGCRALPATADLFGSRQYIKNTSLNPTYGDHMLPSDRSDAEEDNIETDTGDDEFSFLGTPFSLPSSPLHPSELLPNETFSGGSLEQTVNRASTWTPRSLPMLSLCELGASGTCSENMGTLTWRNVIFNHGERPGDDDADNDDHHRIPTEANKTVSDLQIRWKRTLHVDDMELDNFSDNGEESFLHRSAVSDPAMCLECLHDQPSSAPRQGVVFKKLPQRKARGIRRTPVTPIQSISHEAFEEIDFKGHPISETHPGRETDRSVQGAKFSKSIDSSNSKPHNLLAVGLKHTRCALRTLSLLVSRVEIFAASNNKKK